MTNSNNRDKRLRQYGQRALERIAAELRQSKVGNRNNTLNACAHAAGRLISAGAIDATEAVESLRKSAEFIGLKLPEAMATIKSGITAGTMVPRDLAHVGGGTRSNNRRRKARLQTAATPLPTKHTGHESHLHQVKIKAVEAKLRPISGTHGETYFAARGLTSESLVGFSDVCFAKNMPYYEDGQLLGYFDAVIARVRSYATGEIVTHQRTYLNDKGDGKAPVSAPKKAMAAIKGGAVHLGDVLSTTDLGIAEGLENGLTGCSAIRIPGIVTMGKGMFSHFEPAPVLRALTIFADSGEHEQVEAERLADRIRRNGIRVRIVFATAPHNDLNAHLQADGLDAVIATINATPWLEPIMSVLPWNKVSGRADWLYDSVSVAAVEARHIDWLWQPWIALGKLSIIFGQPGQGKSQLLAYLAARVSTGTPFINGIACPRGSVIMIACEDDVADTVRPRLEAAGAELPKVHVLNAVREVGDDGKPKGSALFNLGAGLVPGIISP